MGVGSVLVYSMISTIRCQRQFHAIMKPQAQAFEYRDRNLGGLGSLMDHVRP